MVAPRPTPAPAPPPATPPTSAATATPTAAAEDVQDVLRREAAKLPAASRAPRSSVGSNVLVFVAVLALLVVGIYVANKGKPKEATMFGGGAPAPTPAPAPAPAASGGAADAPAAPADGPPIAGVVALESEGGVVPRGVLFITARSSAMGGKGPPLAARRVTNPSFPYAFQLGPGDRMIKQMPWAGPLDVTARLDADGNAMTKGPEDLTSGTGASNVDLGQDDIRLVLRPGG